MTPDNKRIATFDPRLKILLTICFGLLTWKADYWAVLCYLAVILGLTLKLETFYQTKRSTLFSLSLFILFWIGLKFILQLISTSGSVEQAFLPALQMGTRLMTVLLLGLCLAASTSTRQLGLACNWFFRPFLGPKAWQAALALSLMLHFLPLTLQTIQQSRIALKVRNPQLFFLKKHLLLLKLCLRILSNKTWTQAIALAARNLDQPGAWNQSPDFRLGEWIFGASILIIGLLTNVL